MNWHGHVLATTPRLGPEGFTDKTKELDGGPSGRAEVEWVRELVALSLRPNMSRSLNMDYTGGGPLF